MIFSKQEFVPLNQATLRTRFNSPIDHQSIDHQSHQPLMNPPPLASPRYPTVVPEEPTPAPLLGSVGWEGTQVQEQEQVQEPRGQVDCAGTLGLMYMGLPEELERSWGCPMPSWERRLV